MSRPVLVVTSISRPTPALRALAAAAAAAGIDFVLVGDTASPPDFELDGCEFLSVERQRELPFELSLACPEGHYARKNLGYLVAMRRAASLILETDDDTVAYPGFWEPRARTRRAGAVAGGGWVNAFRYFANGGGVIWPRGFPLERAAGPAPPPETLAAADVDCPIQQGLIDDDPDVDAVYRMLFALPVRFRRGPAVALAGGSWCPFNSQNTAWWPDAYPLLYLPATCSFRVTDIWRSFVAQRIAWANGWSVLFHEPTIRQVRNPHDLSRDFAEEVPGYLGNDEIRAALESFDPRPGTEHLAANMRGAYELLVAGGWLREAELLLLEAWLADVESLSTAAPAVAVG